MTSDDAVDGPEATNKVPRITAPLAEPPTSALPPLPPLNPLVPAMSSVQPRRNSPWPWVLGAAFLAAGSGFGTWWVTDHAGRHSTAPSSASTTPGGLSSSSSPSSTAAVPTDGSPDQQVVAQQLASLTSLVDVHVGFVKAVNRIDRMCNTKPSSGPTTPIAYDHAALAADVQKVHALKDERVTFNTAMEALRGKGSTQAQQVTAALITMNNDAVGVTGQTVGWADRALAQSGRCDMAGDEQITSDPDVAKRNTDRADAWQSFQRLAMHFPIDLAPLRTKLVDPLDAGNTNDTNLF